MTEPGRQRRATQATEGEQLGVSGEVTVGVTEDDAAPERDAAYYAEVRESVGRGTPTLLLGTSTKSLDRSVEKLQVAQRGRQESSPIGLSPTEISFEARIPRWLGGASIKMRTSTTPGSSLRTAITTLLLVIGGCVASGVAAAVGAPTGAIIAGLFIPAGIFTVLHFVQDRWTR